MKDLIIWLERQIEICDELGNMKSEKYAFAHTLKKVRKEAINFTDNSLLLKDKHLPTFESWLNRNCKNYGFAGYLYKGKLVSKSYLLNLYTKEQN